MRNTHKYTKLYSGEKPVFAEGDIFRTIIPLKNISTKKVGTSKLIIKNGDKVAIKNEKEQVRKILIYADSKLEFKTSDIEELLNVKSSRARFLISKLVKDGLLERLGSNKNRSYRLSSGNKTPENESI